MAGGTTFTVQLRIHLTNPDFIWVGLGAPKQEIWMAAHENKVNGLMIGVGAAFDYESGNIKRAPKVDTEAESRMALQTTAGPKAPAPALHQDELQVLNMEV